MTEQQIINEFEGLEVGSSFISRKIGEFCYKYPKQFIAVKDDKLIAVGKSFEEVLNKTREKGLKLSSVLIEYIPDKEEIILY